MKGRLGVTIGTAMLVLILVLAGCGQAPLGSKDRFSELITDKLTVLAGGARFDSAVTMSGDVTMSAGVAAPAGSIDATEIANVTRAVNIPLRSFIECTTDAGADINFSSGADAFPDFINSSTDGLGLTITWDDTGGSVDTAYICDQLTVPPDYVSGGALVLRASKDAHTAGNTEVINCAGSINGAALGTAGTTTVTTSTLTTYTCTPTLTGLAAGNSLSFTAYITSSGTVDDAVSMNSVEFTYTATQ